MLSYTFINPHEHRHIPGVDTSVTQIPVTGRFCVQAVGILFVVAQRTRRSNNQIITWNMVTGMETRLLGSLHSGVDNKITIKLNVLHSGVTYLGALTIVWRKAVIYR